MAILAVNRVKKARPYKKGYISELIKKHGNEYTRLLLKQVVCEMKLSILKSVVSFNLIYILPTYFLRLIKFHLHQLRRQCFAKMPKIGLY